MSWRTNAVLLTVAMLLTIYFRIYEAEAPIWESKGRVFPDLHPSSVTELVITPTVSAEDAELGVSAQQIVLRHEGLNGGLPQWWIVKPFRFVAFHPRAQSLAYELAEMVRVAEVDEDEFASDGQFLLEVRAKTREGEELVLALGRDHLDDSVGLCIARVGGQLFWTRQRSRRKFATSLDELRDRALFSIAPDDVVSVSVDGSSHGDKWLERVPGGSDWRLTRPSRGPADREHTETLLKELNSWSVTDFVNDEPVSEKELEQYGLVSPRAVVTLTKRGGDQKIALEVGVERTAEKQVYVRHVGSNHVFAVGTGPLENLMREAQYFRNRYVFDLELDEVHQVSGERLRGPGKGRRFTLRRVASSKQERGDGVAPPGGDSWEVEDHSYKTKFPADAKIVERFLIDLRRLPVEKFIGPKDLGPTGVEDPSGVLTLTLDSGRALELAVGDVSKDPIDAGNDVFYVKRPDETGAYLVVTVLPLLLAEGGHAFRQRELSDVEPTQVVEVTIRTDGRELSVMRLPGGREWTLPQGRSVEGLNVNPDLIGRLVLKFHPETFRVIRYFPELTDPEPLGLNKVSAPWSVTVRTEENAARLHTLYLGKPVDGTQPLEYYATVDGVDVPFFSLDEEWSKVLQDVYQHLQAVSRR